MNVVMTGAGEFVEVQGTAEQVPFSRSRLDDAARPSRSAASAASSALQRRALDARAERAFTLLDRVLVLATLNPRQGTRAPGAARRRALAAQAARRMIPGAALPDGDGQTYAENALVKARTAVAA